MAGDFVIQPAPENGLKSPMLAPGYADLVTGSAFE